MAELTRAARMPDIGPEYNAFLYATIDTGSSGTLLSVLSAMARMNLDPWQEAADLTALSAKAAARRLATLISAVPGGPSDAANHDVIAARLVKLLPKQTRVILPPLPQRTDFTDIRALAQSPMVRNILFAAIALVLAVMWFSAHQTPAQPPDAAQGSVSARPANGAANGNHN